MPNLSIKVLENSFTKDILDEYIEMVLSHGPTYRWYYSKAKNFSDNFFLLVGNKQFVEKVNSGVIPVSFNFFKLLCKEFHRFGYDYSHLKSIKPKTREDAFKFFESLSAKYKGEGLPT